MKQLYIKFLYINEERTKLIRAALRRTNLPINAKITPVFIQPPNLASRLKPRQTIVCGPHCICGERQMCNIKNCVYIVKCCICSDEYVGETFRTFRARIKDHLTKADSNVHQHFVQKHGTQPTLQTIETKIMKRSFINSLHRKTCEKNIIRSKNCAINVQFSNF